MAIAQEVNNIVIGAASTLSLGAVDLGPVTEDGVTIGVEQEVHDHMNDQSFAKVKQTMLSRNATISFALTESSLANVHKALNLATAALSACTIDIDNTQATAAQVIVAGPGPTAAGSTTRTYTFPSCSQVGNFEMGISKRNEQVLQFDLTAYYVAGTIGTIVDA